MVALSACLREVGLQNQQNFTSYGSVANSLFCAAQTSESTLASNCALPKSSLTAARPVSIHVVSLYVCLYDLFIHVYIEFCYDMHTGISMYTTVQMYCTCIHIYIYI